MSLPNGRSGGDNEWINTRGMSAVQKMSEWIKMTQGDERLDECRGSTCTNHDRKNGVNDAILSYWSGYNLVSRHGKAFSLSTFKIFSFTRFSFFCVRVNKANWCAGNKTKHGWPRCALPWKTQDGKWLYVFHALDERWLGWSSLPPSLLVYWWRSFDIFVLLLWVKYGVYRLTNIILGFDAVFTYSKVGYL